MPGSAKTATLAIAVLVALSVSSCSASELNPDPSACKAALQAQYLQAAAGRQTAGHQTASAAATAEPALCRKLPEAQVRQLEAQVRANP